MKINYIINLNAKLNCTTTRTTADAAHYKTN